MRLKPPSVPSKVTGAAPSKVTGAAPNKVTGGVDAPTVGGKPKGKGKFGATDVAKAGAALVGLGAAVAGVFGAVGFFDDVGEAFCEMVGIDPEENECSAGTGFLAFGGVLLLALVLLIVFMRFVTKKRRPQGAEPVVVQMAQPLPATKVAAAE